MTQPATFPTGWVLDQRGGGRGVRVSAHVDAGFLVLSTWKSDACVATVRLLPDEAARLAANIAEGLARLATPPGAVAGDPLEQRVRELEARLAALEAGEQRSPTGRCGRRPAGVVADRPAEVRDAVVLATKGRAGKVGDVGLSNFTRLAAMSAINCKLDIARRPDPDGDRVVVTFDRKFVDYRW